MSENYDQGATKNKHFKALRVKKVVRVSEGGGEVTLLGHVLEITNIGNIYISTCFQTTTDYHCNFSINLKFFQQPTVASHDHQVFNLLGVEAGPPGSDNLTSSREYTL